VFSIKGNRRFISRPQSTNGMAGAQGNVAWSVHEVEVKELSCAFYKISGSIAACVSYLDFHMDQPDQPTDMAALTDADSQVPITSKNVALLLFGQERYADYLDFQDTIMLTRNRSIYRTEEDWVSAGANSQLVPRGHLPGLRGYRTFLYWLHACGKLFEVHESPANTKLQVAECCGHALHPAIKSDHPESMACPVCISEQATTALSSAWRAWKALGGPSRSPPFDPEGVTCELYLSLRDIWRFEKIRWIGFVLQYEKLSQEMVAWEDEARRTSSAYTVEELREGKSAREALQFARANDPHHVEDADAPFVPRRLLNHHAHCQTDPIELAVRIKSQEASSEQSIDPRSSPPREPPSPPSPPDSPVPSKFAHTPLSSPRRESSSSSPSIVLSPPGSPVVLKKIVTFAVDVVDTNARTVSEFQRASASYQPGRYACPSETVWADTSFCYDKDFAYDNEMSELEKDHQNLLALFPPRNEDTDPTVDEECSGYTENDAGADPAEEQDEFSDAIAKAIMQSLNMEVDSFESHHTPDADVEEELDTSQALSEDAQMLDAMSDVADGVSNSLLASSGPYYISEVADQNIDMLDDNGTSDGAVLPYHRGHKPHDGLEQDEAVTRDMQTEPKTNRPPPEHDTAPDPKAGIRRLAMSGLLETVDDPRGSISDITRSKRELYASSG
jgi:hypothetical protein